MKRELPSQVKVIFEGGERIFTFFPSTRYFDYITQFGYAGVESLVRLREMGKGATEKMIVQEHMSESERRMVGVPENVVWITENVEGIASKAHNKWKALVLFATLADHAVNGIYTVLYIVK